MINAYKAEAHPHALSRKKDPQAIKDEFASAINRKADASGYVTQAAFVDYYAELNFCIPNERSTVYYLIFSILSKLLLALGIFKIHLTMFLSKE